MRIIDKRLLASVKARTVCEFCGSHVPGCEPHHVFTRGAGRLDIPQNVIGLCGAFAKNCHELAQRYKIPREALIARLAIRLGCSEAAIEEIVYALRRTPK